LKYVPVYTSMYQYVPICTSMYFKKLNLSSFEIGHHHIVSIAEELYNLYLFLLTLYGWFGKPHVLLKACTGMYWYILSRTNVEILYWPVPCCTGMYRYLQTCTILPDSVQVCRIPDVCITVLKQLLSKSEKRFRKKSQWLVLHCHEPCTVSDSAWLLPSNGKPVTSHWVIWLWCLSCPDSAWLQCSDQVAAAAAQARVRLSGWFGAGLLSYYIISQHII
jgi:hypothetical protein